MKRNGADLIRMLTLGGLMLAGAHDAAWAGQSVTNLIIEDTDIQAGRTYVNGAGTTVLVGYLTNTNRAILKTHGPDVQDGYELTNATLRLYLDGYGYNAQVNLFRLNVPWDTAAANWYDNTATTQWAAPGLLSGVDHQAAPTVSGNTPASNGFMSLDVTSDVKAFLTGSEVNLSWLVRRQSEAGFSRFRTLEDTESTRRPNIVYHYADKIVRGVVVTNAITADLYISASSPNAPQGGSTMLTGYFQTGIVRCLIGASLPEIPPHAIVESAQLGLYQDNALTGYREGEIIKLHRVLKPWSESSTWKSNTVSSAWTTPGLGSGTDYAATPTDTNVMPLNRHTYFDVTEDVQGFAQGDLTNYGWVAINMKESGMTLSRFRTREETIAAWKPKLIVRYYIPLGTVLTVR